MLSYKEISLEYKKEVKDLTRIVFLLKIKGLFKNKIIFFNKAQIEEILEYTKKTKKTKEFDKRKLTIIEFYIKLKSGRKVASFLNLERKFVHAAIKEYNETNCVIVESKLNYN